MEVILNALMFGLSSKFINRICSKFINLFEYNFISSFCMKELEENII